MNQLLVMELAFLRVRDKVNTDTQVPTLMDMLAKEIREVSSKDYNSPFSSELATELGNRRSDQK